MSSQSPSAAHGDRPLTPPGGPQLTPPGGPQLTPPGDLLCAEELCTGCAACYNVCPFGAIEMVENAWAEAVPRVDLQLCTECGRCTAACPILAPPPLAEPGACHAVWSHDPEDRAESSSGGLVPVLARHVLDAGGAVFGAAVCPSGDQPPRVCHTMARDAAGARPHRKSKYVQSDIGSVYREAGELLRAGTPVLFTGTPCQIAGLRGFLGRDHDGLTAVDFVCHGVPPARYLAEHITAVARPEPAVTDVTFRDADDFRLRLYHDGTRVYDRFHPRDLYFRGFLGGVTPRDGCHACPFTRAERCSDVTVGDFWGLDRASLTADPGGKPSLALINTEKGAALFGEVRDSVHAEERSLAEAVAGNAQLRAPFTAHPRRAAFRAAYPDGGFSRAVRAAGLTREVAWAGVKESAPYGVLRALKRFIVSGRSGSHRGSAR